MTRGASLIWEKYVLLRISQWHRPSLSFEFWNDIFDSVQWFNFFMRCCCSENSDMQTHKNSWKEQTKNMLFIRWINQIITYSCHIWTQRGILFWTHSLPHLMIFNNIPELWKKCWSLNKHGWIKFFNDIKKYTHTHSTWMIKISRSNGLLGRTCYIF